MKFSKYRLTPVLSMTKDDAEEEEYKRKLQSILDDTRRDPGIRQAIYEDMLKRLGNFKDTVKKKSDFKATPIIAEQLPQAPDGATKSKRKSNPGKVLARRYKTKKVVLESQPIVASPAAVKTPIRKSNPNTPKSSSAKRKKALGPQGYWPGESEKSSTTPPIKRRTDGTPLPRKARGGMAFDLGPVINPGPKAVRSGKGYGSDRLKVLKWPNVDWSGS